MSTSTHSRTATVQVLTGPGSVEERTHPVPEDGALLDVLACGLCGSDLASLDGSKALEYPVVLGHEVVGTVSRASEEQLARWGVALGDRVVVEEALPCMSCDLCRDGLHRLCTRLGPRYGDSSLSVEPGLWGGFATTMHLHPASQVHRVPDEVDDASATLFIPLSNGLAWMRERGQVRPGQRVAVIGAGQHGIASALAALHLGAGAVAVVGTGEDTSRLRLAESFGCRSVVTTTTEADVAALVEVLGGRPDVVLDMTPGATGPLRTSIEAAAVGGTVLWGGLKRGEGTATVPVDTLIRKELTLRGLYARPSWAILAALAWLASEPRLAELCQATYPLADLRGAFDAATHPDPRHRPLHVAVMRGEQP